MPYLRYGPLMDHVEWTERPALRDPALVVAFKGWNDAGESASAALGFLTDQFDATQIMVRHSNEYQPPGSNGS